MDISQLMIVGIGLLFVGSAIYVANQEQATGQGGGVLKTMLSIIIGMTLVVEFFALFVGAAVDPAAVDVAEFGMVLVDSTTAMITFGLAVLISLVCFALVYSKGPRVLIRRILAPVATYNPDSSVHMTAVVLSLWLLSYILVTFVASGGISGLAEAIEETGISAGEVAFQGVLFIVIAFLGVGLAVRRTPWQTITRLGLRRPTRNDWRWGIGLGVLLFVVSRVIIVAWTLLVSPEQLAEQTAASEQLAGAINSLALVLVVSLSAGIGEEIFFRGALQPVFGIIPVSLFFALLHPQYMLTPAALVIFIVTLGFGLLRQRHSTTAAVIAHFVYNLIPLLMLLLLGTAVDL